MRKFSEGRVTGWCFTKWGDSGGGEGKIEDGKIMGR